MEKDGRLVGGDGRLAGEAGASGKGGWAGRAVLTILLGMSVTFCRSVIPMRVTVTSGIVALDMVWELAVAALVVVLNREALAEAFRRRFGVLDLLRVLVCWAILFVVANALLIVIPGEVMAAVPSNVVADAFALVLPIGGIVSQCVSAPIFEETVFRLAFRRVLKNPVLFVTIPSLLFAFIHTADFSLGNLYFFFMGCAFALIYLKTKDIRTSILAHAMFNIVGTVMPIVLGAAG